MAPIVAQIEATGEKVQTVDIGAAPARAAKFGVTAVPAFVAVKGDKIVDRHVGVASYARLVEMVAKVSEAAAATPDKIDDPEVGSVGIADEPPVADEWLTAYGFDGGASLVNYRAFVGPSPAQTHRQSY